VASFNVIILFSPGQGGTKVITHQAISVLHEPDFVMDKVFSGTRTCFLLFRHPKTNIDRRSELPPVHQEVRGEPRSFVLGSPISGHHLRKPRTPISLATLYHLCQHGVQGAVEAFHPTIGTRLVSRCSDFVYLKAATEFRHKLALELRSSVRKYL
jgi:hypothetical protein